MLQRCIEFLIAGGKMLLPIVAIDLISDYRMIELG
jgi:hypothetical protein